MLIKRRHLLGKECQMTPEEGLSFRVVISIESCTMDIDSVDMANAVDVQDSIHYYVNSI